MMRCPQCNRTYSDETVLYCLDDGTLLTVSREPPETLILPQSRPTDPFPNIVLPAQSTQPQIVRQGVRPAVVYVLVALLAMVVAGGAVALYYESGKSNTTSDANKQAEVPVKSPPPTPTESGNKTQPTPDKTPQRENAGGSVPGKYPEGSTRLLTDEDVAGKSPRELKIMKNEIYARHGYIFKTPELKSYFESQPWYKPTSDDVTNLLSNIEIQNAAFIKGYE